MGINFNKKVVAWEKYEELLRENELLKTELDGLKKDLQENIVHKSAIISAISDYVYKKIS